MTIFDLNNTQFRVSPKLSFPEYDILSYCEKTGVVELRFMGLLGVDSPLPYYLSAYADLLQPLSHYFYTLFFEASYKKYLFDAYINYFDECKKYSRQNVLKLLQQKLSPHSVEITEFIPAWVELDSHSKKLGEVVLGQRVLVSRLQVTIPRNADHVVIGQWIMH